MFAAASALALAIAPQRFVLKAAGGLCLNTEYGAGGIGVPAPR